MDKIPTWLKILLVICLFILANYILGFVWHTFWCVVRLILPIAALGFFAYLLITKGLDKKT